MHVHDHDRVYAVHKYLLCIEIEILNMFEYPEHELLLCLVFVCYCCCFFLGGGGGLYDVGCPPKEGIICTMYGPGFIET